MNRAHLPKDPAGYPAAPLALQASRPLGGRVSVEARLWGQDEDLVQTLTRQKIEVGGGPGTPVDETVVIDAHRLVPPGDRTRSHDRLGKGGRTHPRTPERDSFTGVVVESDDGYAVAGDPPIRDHMGDQRSHRVEVAPALGQECGKDCGGWQLMQLTRIVNQQLSGAQTWTRTGRSVAAGGLRIVEMKAGQPT